MSTTTQARNVGVSNDDQDSLSQDELFKLLKNQRRRWALHYLKYADGDQVELGTLAENVAAWENGVTVEELTSNQRKVVYTSLQQTHLPTLDESNVVDFDSDAGVVELAKGADELSIYLEAVGDDSIPWSQYYTAVGIAGCVISLGAFFFDGVPFSVVPDITWGLILSIILAVSGAVHMHRNQSMKLSDRRKPPEVSTSASIEK